MYPISLKTVYQKRYITIPLLKTKEYFMILQLSCQSDIQFFPLFHIFPEVFSSHETFNFFSFFFYNTLSYGTHPTCMMIMYTVVYIIEKDYVKNGNFISFH